MCECNGDERAPVAPCAVALFGSACSVAQTVALASGHAPSQPTVLQLEAPQPGLASKYLVLSYVLHSCGMESVHVYEVRDELPYKLLNTIVQDLPRC